MTSGSPRVTSDETRANRVRGTQPAHLFQPITGTCQLVRRRRRRVSLPDSFPRHMPSFKKSRIMICPRLGLQDLSRTSYPKVESDPDAAAKSTARSRRKSVFAKLRRNQDCDLDDRPEPHALATSQKVSNIRTWASIAAWLSALMQNDPFAWRIKVARTPWTGTGK